MKQGCVLAPTLFSLYPAAMLEVTFKDTSEGVYIQTRKDVDLFIVAQFKTECTTSIKVIREMLFANDIALVSHSAQYMQSLVEKFVRAASQFSLKINIKKTERRYGTKHQSSNSQHHYQKRSALVQSH